MNVGIALTPWAAAVSWHLSTSTFKKTARGNLVGNCSKCGAIIWHGPHLFNTKDSLESVRTFQPLEKFLPTRCEVNNNQTYSSRGQLRLKMGLIFDRSNAHVCSGVFLFAFTEKIVVSTAPNASIATGAQIDDWLFYVDNLESFIVWQFVESSISCRVFEYHSRYSTLVSIGRVYLDACLRPTSLSCEILKSSQALQASTDRPYPNFLSGQWGIGYHTEFPALFLNNRVVIIPLF